MSQKKKSKANLVHVPQGGRSEDRAAVDDEVLSGLTATPTCEVTIRIGNRVKVGPLAGLLSTYALFCWQAVRRPVQHPERKSASGYFRQISNHMIWSVVFDSMQERSHMQILTLEAPPDSYIVSQPMVLTWQFSKGVVVSHIPDMLHVRTDGRLIIVDVKARDQWTPRFCVHCLLTAQLAAACGLEYLVLDELSSQTMLTLDELSMQRYPTQAQLDAADRARQVFDEGANSFGALRYSLGDDAAASSAVILALATGRLFVDLTRPVTIFAELAITPPAVRHPWVFTADEVAESVRAWATAVSR